MLAGHDQVLDHGHVLDQREVLVDHAEAEGVGLARVLQLDRVLADAHRTGVGLVGAHDALDQRALAGAVLAEQRAEAAGPQRQRHVGQHLQRAEGLDRPDHLDDGAAARRPEAMPFTATSGGGESDRSGSTVHGRASNRAWEGRPRRTRRPAW